MPRSLRPARVPRLPRPTAAAVLAVAVVAGVALAIGVPGGATADTPSTTTHIVRSGDTVHSVAARYGVDAQDVRAANGIVDDRLYVGARLVIDGSAAGPARTAAPSGTYVVEQGDVLIHIARDHGVSLRDLLTANDLDATTIILPGDRLTIPARAGGVSTSVASWPRVVCPVAGASFMNDWGFPRGSDRFHEGTDLFAPTGTPIVAPVTGELRFDRNRLGGLTFTISTPSGWRAYGAHLSETVGGSRWVAAGELIGRVGDSGNARGGDPHLHLELDRGGSSTNPYPSLNAAC